MKKIILVILVLSFFVPISFMGCAKKAASSQEAIETSKGMKSVQEQVSYLVGQAKSFINSKEFDQAIQTAQYVLSNLDQNSTEAKSIIEKAKDELQKAAQGAVADVKKSLGGLGQ